MKEVKIRLDDKSVEILKEVEAIHRDSLINFAIRLLEEHPHYKIIKGEKVENITELNKSEDVSKLNNLEEETETKKEEYDVSFDEW